MPFAGGYLLCLDSTPSVRLLEGTYTRTIKQCHPEADAAAVRALRVGAGGQFAGAASYFRTRWLEGEALAPKLVSR